MTDLFPGTVTNVPVSPYPSGLTFVGAGTTPWADATDDSTEAVLEQDWDGSDNTVFTRVHANLPALTGTPTALIMHMRAQQVSGSEDAHVSVVLQNASQSIFVAIGNEGPGFFQHVAVPASGFADYAIDLATPNNLYAHWGTSLAAVTTLLQSGLAMFQVQVDVYTPHAAFSQQVAIAALWLECVMPGSGFATAVPSQLISPLRQHPRTDGLGTSSTPRQWPPSRSVQASNRRAGGYL